jgi:lysophospholipase L1-like esterase
VNCSNFSIDKTSGIINQGQSPLSAFKRPNIIPMEYLDFMNLTIWNTRKWTAFGDSITYLNSWQPYVVKKLGLIHTNRGIGGTTVANTGSIAYVDSSGNYMDRPPNPQPTGSTQINSSMSVDDRINTIPTDTQLITIFGGRNDYGQNVPLGAITDTVDTTFYGALQIMINKIHTRIPNARKVILIPIYSSDDGTVNSVGKTFDDYRNAIKQIAYLYGYPVIDLKANTGINKLNSTAYLSDGIHPNDAGGQRIAEVVIGQLKALEPVS